jgi:hypothetical protein
MTKLTMLKIGGNIFILKFVGVVACLFLIYKIEKINNEIITLQEQLVDIHIKIR